MAAPAKYPTPIAQLAILARSARRRGLTFDEFWQEAVRPGFPPITSRIPVEHRPTSAVMWPGDTHDRQNWQAAIRAPEVVEGWRRAYEGCSPTRGEAALRLLGSEFRVDPAEVDALDRRGVGVEHDLAHDLHEKLLAATVTEPRAA